MTSSQHHTFDIELATEFGIEEALLIHHFQHWIRFNRTLKKNFIDGKTWSYQKREDIAAHFPYLTKKSVRLTTEKLVARGVLVCKNFSEDKFKKTLWYAFNDEKRFIGNSFENIEENSNKNYESPKGQIECPKGQIEMPKRANQYIGTDTKHTDTLKEKVNQKENQKQIFKNQHLEKGIVFIEKLKRKNPHIGDKLSYENEEAIIQTPKGIRRTGIGDEFFISYIKYNMQEWFGNQTKL